MTIDGATGTLLGVLGTGLMTWAGSAYIKHRELKASKQQQDDNQEHKKVEDDVKFLLGESARLEAKYTEKFAEQEAKYGEKFAGQEKRWTDKMEEMRREFEGKSAVAKAEWDKQVTAMKQDWSMRELEMASQIAMNEKEIGRLTSLLADATLAHSQAIAEWRQRSMQQQIDHQGETITRQESYYREKMEMGDVISSLKQQVIDMRQALDRHQIACPDTAH